jgi:WD40 repeat protein
MAIAIDVVLMVAAAEEKAYDTIGKAWALEFSSDGNVLYSTSYDGRVVLWDTRSFKHITEIETKGSFGMSIAAVSTPVIKLIFQSGDGKYFASGHQNGGIYVYSTETNRILYTLPGIVSCIELTQAKQALCDRFLFRQVQTFWLRQEIQRSSQFTMQSTGSKSVILLVIPAL